MNRNTGMSAGQIIGTMNGLQVMGLDIAKHVFQLHTVDMGTGEIANVQIKRAKVLEYFVNKPKSLIAIEACGGAHHWARELTALGHSARSGLPCSSPASSSSVSRPLPSKPH